MTELTPDILLNAYRHGLFPMAEAADASDLNWYLPEQRGQLPIANLHVPKSLRKLLLKTRPFTVNVNTDFRAIIAMCAEETQDRPSTWINDTIIDLYCDLHAAGHAHSVECRDPSSGEIFGGLYGVSIGQIFCGESMVSRAPNASKVALVHLCARLQTGRFKVLDTQFINDHLLQFGL